MILMQMPYRLVPRPRVSMLQQFIRHLLNIVEIHIMMNMIDEIGKSKTSVTVPKATSKIATWLPEGLAFSLGVPPSPTSIMPWIDNPFGMPMRQDEPNLMIVVISTTLLTMVWAVSGCLSLACLSLACPVIVMWRLHKTITIIDPENGRAVGKKARDTFQQPQVQLQLP